MAAPALNHRLFAAGRADEGNVENFTDYASILQCAINVALNVSEETEIYAIWEKYEPKLDAYLANIRGCPSLGDDEAILQSVFSIIYEIQFGS